MTFNADVSTFGEQGMGFALGEQGFFFVEGPSGDGGHNSNARGLDGLAYSPTADKLKILDNKTFAKMGNVGDATAIDPAKNLETNLNKSIKLVESMPHLPYRDRIMHLLRVTVSGVTRQGVNLPPNVEIVVTNFGGRSTGLTDKMMMRGLTFENLNPVMPPKWKEQITPEGIVGMARRYPSVSADFVNRTNTVAAAAGVVDMVSQAAHDYSVQRAIDRAVKEQARWIGEVFARGEGCLLIIVITQSKNASPAREVRRVYVQGGRSREEAIYLWETQPHLLQGYPDNFLVYTSYTWLPLPKPASDG